MIKNAFQFFSIFAVVALLFAANGQTVQAGAIQVGPLLTVTGGPGPDAIEIQVGPAPASLCCTAYQVFRMARSTTAWTILSFPLMRVTMT